LYKYVLNKANKEIALLWKFSPKGERIKWISKIFLNKTGEIL